MLFISRYEKNNCNDNIYDDEIKKNMDDGIHSLLICLQLYQQRVAEINDTDDTNEKLFSLLGLSYLYQKKEEHYHDGSWVLAKYYKKRLENSLKVLYKEKQNIDTLHSPKMTYKAYHEGGEPSYQEFTKITEKINDFLNQKLDEHFYELK